MVNLIIWVIQIRFQSNTTLNLPGGERGIRTLDTLVEYTRFPGVRLRPLGHLSIKN